MYINHVTDKILTARPTAKNIVKVHCKCRSPGQMRRNRSHRVVFQWQSWVTLELQAVLNIY